MVATPQKRTITCPASPSTSPPLAPELTPQQIYYADRVVRLTGRLYWVKWCNGTHVCVTAKQGLYGGTYQPHPMQSFDFNEWIVPVNYVFLSVV
jgi:hypothetical protein